MELLPDDSYDVIVVDAETSDDGTMRIEVTITLGPYVGHVIPLRRRNIVDDHRGARAHEPRTTCSGIPGTLRVRNGSADFVPNVCDVTVPFHVIELAMPRRVHVAWWSSRTSCMPA